MIRRIAGLAIIFLLTYINGWILPNQSKKLKMIFLKGIMWEFAVFEILTVPAVFLKLSLTQLILIYGVVLTLTAGWVIWKYAKKMVENLQTSILDICKNRNLWYMPALVLMAVQIFFAISYMHVDDDDAFYVASAVTSVHTDTLYEFSAYTGEPLSELPSRYVLSPFPMLLAVVSKVLALHPAITAHTLYPFFGILSGYLVYMIFAELFFGEKKKEKGLFVFFAALMTVFGYYSVYSAATFMSIRIWQGKAFLAAVILPFFFVLLSEKMQMEFQKSDYVTIVAVMLAGALCSSMGVFLMPMMLGMMGLIYGIAERKYRTVVKLAICCIPDIILAVCYVLMKAGGAV